jgi:hypothetical protein
MPQYVVHVGSTSKAAPCGVAGCSQILDRARTCCGRSTEAAGSCLCQDWDKSGM